MLSFNDFLLEITDEINGENLHEMANLTDRWHGISGVVIWVGKANKRHGLRVKVSNIKGKYSETDNFVIQMPTLDYDNSQVSKWIVPKLEEIKDWIKLNQGVLYDYENGIIQDTGDFLEKIVKI